MFLNGSGLYFASLQDFQEAYTYFKEGEAMAAVSRVCRKKIQAKRALQDSLKKWCSDMFL